MVQSRVLLKADNAAFDIFEDELGTQIFERTKALARLVKMQEIDLSYHGRFTPLIYNVMSGIESLVLDGSLCTLCKLDLSHNQLSRFPKEIGSLLSLTHLFLNDNNLSSLQPIIIRRLVNLQELDLRNNKLNNFSLDITELSCLRRLSVQGNPLKDDETRKLMKLAHNERWIDIAGEYKTSSQRICIIDQVQDDRISQVPFCVIMDRDKVQVDINAKQNHAKALSHLDRTSLVKLGRERKYVAIAES